MATCAWSGSHTDEMSKPDTDPPASAAVPTGPATAMGAYPCCAAWCCCCCPIRTTPPDAPDVYLPADLPPVGKLEAVATAPKPKTGSKPDAHGRCCADDPGSASSSCCNCSCWGLAAPADCAASEKSILTPKSKFIERKAKVSGNMSRQCCW